MANKFDTIVRNGLVVSGTRIRKADVGIQGEQIAAIEDSLLSEGAGRIIDAGGKYILPGAIDVHVHPVYEDNIGGLSFSSAHGGTTFLIHYAYARPGMKLMDTIKSYKDDALKTPTWILPFTERSLTRPRRLRRSPRLLNWALRPSKCL
jgi:dihydroorotase-like cyclic amidohydrolase